MNHIEFDSTLDEIVDVNMRLVEHTAAYRQQRTRFQWAVGVCVAGALVAIILVQTEMPSYAALAIASSAALGGGVAVGFLYGRYHDRHVRHYYRRIAKEMYGGVEQVHWEFELRKDALWTKSAHAEVSFPWVRLTRVNDTQGSIELWFDPGLAVVRDRAFPTEKDRERFLDAVKNYVLRERPGT